ncbi:MAG: AbgT family transporter [Roseibacillus sp.]
MSVDPVAAETPKKSGWLDRIERLGNRLPHPMTLFIAGAILVLVLSQIADSANWSVDKTVMAPNAEGVEVKTVVPVTAKGLLAGDGAYWALDYLVKNFTGFAPLGVVLVGMLGIGVAERSGAIGAMLKVGMLITPQALLTPAMIFLGVMSSMALDAGYVVLPPIAAALYKSVGRSPLVGIAAVFVGVSAGFSANLSITGLDPLLAGFTSEGAQILNPDYEVAATANWWFMILSTVVLTFVGWAVTSWFVEPRAIQVEDRPQLLANPIIDGRTA